MKKITKILAFAILLVVVGVLLFAAIGCAVFFLPLLGGALLK